MASVNDQEKNSNKPVRQKLMVRSISVEQERSYMDQKSSGFCGTGHILTSLRLTALYKEANLKGQCRGLQEAVFKAFFLFLMHNLICIVGNDL